MKIENYQLKNAREECDLLSRLHSSSWLLSIVNFQFSISSRRKQERKGFVLLAVLIVIVILSLAAYRYSDMTMAEYRASDRILKSAEAKALADSGIHYAAAILADKDAFTNTLGGNPTDNAGIFQNKSFEDGRSGRFSVLYVDYTQDSGAGSLPLKYGVIDEAGKLNLNGFMQLDSTGQVLYNALTNTNQPLPGMTADIANSIIDWMDADDDTRSGGAEASFYSGRSPGYRCKNGPLDSLEELLLVKGIAPMLLFGNDLNRNGRRDPDEETGGEFSYGWAPYLTVYSRERNYDNSGARRININGKDLKTLYGQLKTAIGADSAAYIIGYRIYDLPTANSKTPTKAGTTGDLVTKVEASVNGKSAPRSRRNISSILQLIGTSVSVAGSNNQPATIYAFPITNPETARDLLPVALDKLTTVSDKELPPRINVNTAPRNVLLALPGLDSSDVDDIVSRRPSAASTDPSDPIYTTPAWLYTEDVIPAAKLIALERYVTARSQVYRIQSVGYFERGGPVVRVEAIVDTNDGKPRILYYRDLTELGRAIDPRNQ